MSLNPYEAPQYQATLSSLTYYQPLTTKLNLGEYRRISKNWFEFVLGVCLKFLRIRLPMSFAFADTAHFQRLTPQDLSVRAREQIKPVADEALALKLKYAFSYWLPTVGTIEGAAATFLSEDGRSILLIIYARTWTQVTADEKVAFAFVTRLADGKAIVTSGSKADLDSPPHLLGESHPGMPMADLLNRHQQRVREVGTSIMPVYDENQLEEVLREYERENFAFNVERGVYVPVSQRELARLQQLAVAAPVAPKSKAKQRFQGIEMFCWITLGIGVFMFSRDAPVNGAQAIFRVSILVVAGAGIVIIWVIRGVTSLRSEADG
ncbi:MAG: hypothetical protein H6822_03980 [Planctomycetaceae bacterium]|nr:hypothetical protein [Planctomycetales bacterium]MCB9921316.1 hypothetical protein [Planctomycetaceae bacterium]